MVQTLKNCANLVTVAGDYYLYGETQSFLSMTAILIMIIGAVFASANDIEFSLLGYFWMGINCLCTACKFINCSALSDDHCQNF